MKVWIDQDLCTGDGLCEEIAPDVFVLLDDGLAYVRDGDTIYAEGQRRYVESLSAYARQFLSVMEKPAVDHIEGLSPAISIEQKSASHNPRSTVGTVTEIYDYLRLLFARAGVPRCPTHDTVLDAQNVSQMVDQVLNLEEGTRVMVLAPVVTARKGTHADVLADLRARGFVRVRIDGTICDLDNPPTLDRNYNHTIETVVDRLRVRPEVRLRLAESFETTLALADGVAQVGFMDEPGKESLVFSGKFACPVCGYGIPELEPRLFSFNSPVGACADCDGLGVQIRVEVHGKDTQEPRRMRTIMDHADHPNAYVCWNSNFGEVQDGSIEANYRLLAHRIGLVHITEIYRPEYPWRELFRLLQADGYDGYTLAEIAHSPEPERLMGYYRALWEANQA